MEEREVKLNAVVTVKGNEDQPGFMGIVTQVYGDRVIICVGRTITKYGKYGIQYERVLYGARMHEIEWDGKTYLPSELPGNLHEIKMLISSLHRHMVQCAPGSEAGKYFYNQIKSLEDAYDRIAATHPFNPEGL